MLKRTLDFWRGLSPVVKGIVVTLGLIAAYLPFLEVMEAREEARLVRLSHAEPALYLDAVRNRQGVRSYLEALAEIRHFDHWREAAPTFLIGAWALAPPEEADRSTAPGRHCISGMVIEDGQIRYFGEEPHHVDAEYRIDRYDHVLARVADGGTLTISVPRHARGEHAIEVELPGMEAPLYGYRCR